MFHTDFYSMFSDAVLVKKNQDNIFTLTENDPNSNLQKVHLKTTNMCKLLKIDPDFQSQVLKKICKPATRSDKNDQRKYFCNIFASHCCDYILYDGHYTYFIELKSKNYQAIKCCEKFLATLCTIQHLQKMDSTIRNTYFNDDFWMEEILPVFMVFHLPKPQPENETWDKYLYEESHYLLGHMSSRNIEDGLTNLTKKNITNDPTTPYFIPVNNDQSCTLEKIKNAIIAGHKYIQHLDMKETLRTNKPLYIQY